MKKIVKDAFALFCITLVAGLLLAVVYGITKEPIALAEAEKAAAAYRSVYAEASSFKADDTVTAAVKDAEDVLKKAGFTGVTLTDALYALDADGNRIGCVMTLGGKGYGGIIEFTLGITADEEITGISILSHEETPGLGAKCTEEAFYGQFAGKPASKLNTVKETVTTKKDIIAISGATVTSNAVVNAVNGGIWFAENYMQIGGGK